MQFDKQKIDETVKGISLLEGFKDFIAKGNVMDMGLGVIFVAPFAAIVEAVPAGPSEVDLVSEIRVR